MEQCDNLDHLNENKQTNKTPIIPHAGITTINKYPGMYLLPVFLNMYFFSIKQSYIVSAALYAHYIYFLTYC